MKSFTYKQFDQVLIVYNEFVNAAIQNVNVEQFLPLVPAVDDQGSKSKTQIIFSSQTKKRLLQN